MRLSVLNPESERAPFADPRIRSDTAALSISVSIYLALFLLPVSSSLFFFLFLNRTFAYIT